MNNEPRKAQRPKRGRIGEILALTLVFGLISLLVVMERLRHTPTGPAVNWTTELDSIPLDLEVREDGTVYLITEDSLYAVRNGNTLWQQPLAEDAEDWLLDLGQEGLLIGGEGAVFCHDPENGEIRWQVDLPEIQWRGRATPRDAAKVGDDVLLLSGSQVAILHPRRCSDSPWSCLDPFEEIGRSFLRIHASHVMVADDGHRLYWSNEWVIVTSDDNELLMAANKPGIMTAVGDPVLGENGVVDLVVDEDLFTFHAPSCQTDLEQVVSLPPSNQDHPLPMGCLRHRVRLRDADLISPSRIASGTLVSGFPNKLWLVSDGQIRWQHADQVVLSRFLQMDNAAVFACAYIYENTELCALDPDSGDLDWRSHLTNAPDNNGLCLVDIAGRWIVISQGTYLAGIQISE